MWLTGCARRRFLPQFHDRPGTPWSYFHFSWVNYYDFFPNNFLDSVSTFVLCKRQHFSSLRVIHVSNLCFISDRRMRDPGLHGVGPRHLHHRVAIPLRNPGRSSPCGPRTLARLVQASQRQCHEYREARYSIAEKSIMKQRISVRRGA